MALHQADLLRIDVIIFGWACDADRVSDVRQTHNAHARVMLLISAVPESRPVVVCSVACHCGFHGSTNGFWSRVFSQGISLYPDLPQFGHGQRFSTHDLAARAILQPRDQCSRPTR